MTNLLVKLFIKDYENVSEPSVRSSYGKFSGKVGIFCNMLLFALKAFIGTITHSVSITADAVNNLSDAASSVISLIGFKMAEKPADKEAPAEETETETPAAEATKETISEEAAPATKESSTPEALAGEPVKENTTSVTEEFPLE